MAILVTGGAGYIGSHTCVELLHQGIEVVVLDNFANSRPEALRRVEKITGKKTAIVAADVCDRDALRTTFSEHSIDAVIHFAGAKSVGESVEKPLLYFHNNVAGTIHLLEAMDKAGVRTLVFSSSATVYGNPHHLPIAEDHPLSATNPYGRTKLMVEDILRELATHSGGWRIALLRYFNPVGAHESGLIGEDPLGTPNNLMPFLAQVAIGTRPMLRIFGGDYSTPDGTGVRDYIHVVDLALGHLAALARLRSHPGLFTVNLGTGSGHSVLEMVRLFESASGRLVPYQIAERRLGDVASCYADPARAADLLGWKSLRDPIAMCADAWRWQQQNPNGYSGSLVESEPQRKVAP